MAEYEVVISGIGGRFPESDTVDELKKNLFDKVNMVTMDDRKWIKGELEVPVAVGKMKDIDLFDTTFFGIHRKLCESMDALTRQCMERTYEAIFDAGVNPVELNGSNTAVFMSSTVSESEFITIFDTKRDGFGILGHNRSMQANRVSYAFNFTGPSYSMDGTWAGGMQGLEQAKQMISDGHVRAALVGVSNIVRHPTISLQFLGMGNLTYDDKVRSFSADADGYNRSEAIVVLFLQRAVDAKRCYATLLHTKAWNFGDRTSFFEQTSADSFKTLLRDMYSEAKIDPASIAYIEADGSASKKLDARELNTVDEVLCRDRKDPLLIGSVKSNLGHTEAAASLVSVVKALIALDSGRIPPNLHYAEPNPDVPALLSGKLKVVTEEVPLPGDIVGVTTFGLSGTYGHVILKRNKKLKQRQCSKDTLPPDGLPRLLVVSGRDLTGLQNIITQLEEIPLDEEFIALMHNVFLSSINLHMFRGYVVLPKLENSESDAQPISRTKESPVWFVFSGMGSQWPGMGAQLLQLPVFAAAIDKCEAALVHKGISVRNIITNTDPGFFDNILHSFVGIAAMQIGLVDLLFSLGIKPDGIIGHSVGELGCAYADGCFSAEEMIQCAYARGQASIETKLIKGMMAAVGKGYAQIKNDLPETIEVACHNSSESCTLSGPASDMEKYIAELKETGVFAKLVNVSDIAYHSRYIAPAAPTLLQYLKEVINEPKPRSERWISSSIPKDQWDTPLAQTSSPEYHTNNLLSSVLFEEASQSIPNEAILIEIAPHGLLQAILRRSQKLCVNIPLTQRDNKDGVRFLLSAIGKMYMAGMQPDISKLYPPVEFPVSNGTPALQPFVCWDHSEMWKFGNIDSVLGLVTGERQVSIDISDPKEKFFENHQIIGRVIVPSSMYLFMAWESLLHVHKEQTFSKRVIFEDVQFYQTVELTTIGTTRLYILLQKGSGHFEVCLGPVMIASGRVNFLEDSAKDLTPDKKQPVNEPVSEVYYTADEVYTMIDGLGYQHGKNFRVIDQVKINENGLTGNIKWTGDWVVFMDALLKITLFTEIDMLNTLLVPASIHKLCIDPTFKEDLKTVSLTYNNVTKVMYCSGIKVKMVRVEHSRTELLPLHMTGLRLEERKFVPHRNTGVEDINTFINLCLQLIIESLYLPNEDSENRMTIITLSKEANDINLTACVQTYCKELKSETIITSGTPDNMYDITDDNHNYIIIADNMAELEEAIVLLDVRNKSFILACIPHNSCVPADFNLAPLLQQVIGKDKIILLKKVSKVSDKECCIVHSSSLDWAEELSKGLGSRKEVEKEVGSRKEGEKKVSSRKEVEKEVGSRKEVEKEVISRKVGEKEVSSRKEEEKEVSSRKEGEKEVISRKEGEKEVSSKKAEEKEEDPANEIVYFVVNGEPLAGVSAFVRSVSKIGDVKNLRFVFLMDKEVPAFSITDPFYQAQLGHDLRVNVYKDGEWGSYRHFHIAESVTPNPLNLEEPTTHLAALSLDGLDVKYLGLNLRDLVISKREKVNCELGHLEYAGITRDGKRVMGLVQFQATATRLCPDPYLSWSVPSHWSLEDAATVPLPYTIAYYALVITSRAAKNERVLIHAGYNAVGQAAIVIALYIGCEVYTTYSTKEQLAFLKKSFPQLIDSHIKCFEDPKFDVNFLMETNGEGFGVIMNCLEREKLHASVRCVGQNGRFIQLGQTDLQKKSTLGMYVFLKAISVFGSSADNLFDFTDEKKKELNSAVAEGIKSGVVRPLDRKVMTGPCTGEEALKTLKSVACGSYGGRVVLALEGEKSPKVSKDINGKYSCDPDKTYLIIGGKSGLWVELVEWLAIRGARKLLVAVAKHAMSSHTARRFNLLLMRYNSASIHLVSACRADSKKEATKLLTEATTLGPLAAIFFLVISDNSNKVANLDWASRTVVTTNPQFVCILSGSADICEKRRTAGMPALALLWDKPFSKPARIIPALDHLLNKEASTSVIVLSEHSLSGNTENENMINQDMFHLPETLNDLAQLGFQTGSTDFIEVPTKSLRYKAAKGVTTVFVIPGIKPGQIDKLVSNLIYPAFQAVLPQNVTSLGDVAAQLFQVLKRDFNHLGMFTLLAETWGGALALTLAQLLEADGKEATLVLLDGSPETTKTILQPLFENLDGQLIKRYISAKALQESSNISDWEERIDTVLSTYSNKEEIKNGFRALRSRLHSLYSLQVPEVPSINSKVHLFRAEGSIENDNCGLNLYCTKSINITLSLDMDLKQMIDSHNLSKSVNSLAYYEYFDRAVTMTDQLASIEVNVNSNRNLGLM